MLDKIAIEDTLISALTLVTGDTSIVANQDAPRPSGSYSSVYITPARKLGLDRVTLANDAGQDLDETIEGHREVKISINFFRINAFTNASEFETRLQSNALIDLFKSNGLGFSLISDVRDISEVNKEKWEERAQLDLTVYALTNFTETVSAIEEVNVNGIAESGNNQTNININIK